MIVADHNVWSFAEQAAATAAVVLTVLIPILVAAGRDRRRRGQRYMDSLASLHDKADETLRVTNSIHIDESVDGAPEQTLGTVLRSVERKVDAVDTKLTTHTEMADAAFQRNDQTHDAIIRTVDTVRETIEVQGELLHDHGQRLDAQRAEMDRSAPRRGGPDTVTP